MKKIAFVITLFLLSFPLSIYAEETDLYKEGYITGYTEGFGFGHLFGSNGGYNDGISDEFSYNPPSKEPEFIEDDYENGYESGYTDGLKDGYDYGYINALEYYSEHPDSPKPYSNKDSKFPYENEYTTAYSNSYVSGYKEGLYDIDRGLKEYESDAFYQAGLNLDSSSIYKLIGQANGFIDGYTDAYEHFENKETFPSKKNLSASESEKKNIEEDLSETNKDNFFDRHPELFFILISIAPWILIPLLVIIYSCLSDFISKRKSK